MLDQDCIVINFQFFQYILHQGEGDWLGSDELPLEGFSWRGGCERDTTGILLWSEVFLADLPNGDKVRSIIIMFI